jgi:hypothetical protein
MNKHQNKNDQRVKSEKEEENEQIQNGGATIIFKDDEKTVNKNYYIDIPTTNKCQGHLCVFGVCYLLSKIYNVKINDRF